MPVLDHGDRMTWMLDAYPWVKALHIVSVIAWMSGLLYLPRLFVYHADAPAGRPSPRPSRSWSAGSTA